jgi:hypothetical protein
MDEMRNQIMSRLAEVNIARALAPITDPLMSGFVEQLDAINALADNSPGFLWRLQTPEGNATALHPYEDDLIIVNLSLWASLADLSAFVYESRHRSVLQQRRQWFERFDGPYLALWWVPSGHLPTIEEAKERLAFLRDHGETAYAFSFKRQFPAPASDQELDQDNADAEEYRRVLQTDVIDKKRVERPKDKDQPDEPLERYGSSVGRRIGLP